MTPISRTHSQNALSTGPFQFMQSTSRSIGVTQLSANNLQRSFQFQLPGQGNVPHVASLFCGGRQQVFGSPCANLSKSNKTSEKRFKAVFEVAANQFRSLAACSFCGSNMKTQKIKTPATID